MKGCQYTVERCKKDGTLYGRTHGSNDVVRTFCGRRINQNWWVLTNNENGVVTCPRCIEIGKQLPFILVRS